MIEVPVGHGKVATIYLHVEVAKRKFNREIPDQVDHEDRNPLNCRRYNLRLATNSQNKMNKDVAYLSCTGFKGVSKHGNRFRAKIWNNDQQYHLGLFDTAEEAAAAYNAEAFRLYGEFAVLNEI
jgi:hypothetical protein